ncbi:hypothetical protein D5086_032643 [Populus alba]|uniref:Uncharacterized protein n=3 Tax=Populus TaxID=3689 RepID=A0ACC4AEL2_POPAL|nr:hypothetical protein NC653_040578 [Populus alba x Populus x berolinensis]
MATITTRKKKKKGCVKKKHRKRWVLVLIRNLKWRDQLSAKHDLGITVLYGEEVLKSQFRATSDEEVADWVKTV